MKPLLGAGLDALFSGRTGVRPTTTPRWHQVLSRPLEAALLDSAINPPSQWDAHFDRNVWPKN